MASETISTDTDWADLTSTKAYNETVTINSGAVLTIDESTIDAQGTSDAEAGVNITNVANQSTFRITNASNTNSLKYYGPESGSLRIESGSTLEISGDYIILQDTGSDWQSDGTADQSLPAAAWTDLYDAADEPAVIFVETGDSTGVYDAWLNSGDVSLNDLGVGDLGKWFSYNTITGVITFGDGGSPEDLAYDASASQSYVDVADASSFSASDVIHIVSDAGQQTTSIASISSGGGVGGSDRVNLDDNTTQAYNTSDNAFIRVTKGCNIPPNNARVRVYNIGIGKVDSGGSPGIHATAGTNFELDSSSGGNINIDKCYFFGFYSNTRDTLSASFHNVGMVHYINGFNIKAGDFQNVHRCINRYATSQNAMYLYFCAEANLQNCKLATKSSGVCLELSQSRSTVINNCEFVIAARDGVGDSVVSISTSAGTTITDTKLIGGRNLVSDSPNTIFTNCAHSDSPHGEPYGSLYTFTFTFGAVNSAGGTVDGLTLIADGAASRYSSSMFSNVSVIKNCNYEAETSYVVTGSNGGSVYDCYFGEPSSDMLNTAGFHSNWALTNVRLNNFPDVTNDIPSNFIIKACDCDSTSVPLTNSATIDSIFYEVRTATGTPDTGLMGVFFSPQSSGAGYYTTSGNVVFNGTGRLYIKSAGGYIEYTWPHWVRGVTGFDSGGSVNVNGSGTGNFTLQYQIDTGSGWGSLQTLNHTNLSAETIDADVGFRFRLRISHSAGSTSNYIYRVNWDTEVDYDTYKYSESLVDVIIENVIDGSEWQLYNITRSVVIDSGTHSGSGDITVSDVPYWGSDDTLRLRVRNATSSPFYKPFTTNATLTDTGARIYVSQIEDE